MTNAITLTEPNYNEQFLNSALTVLIRVGGPGSAGDRVPLGAHGGGADRRGTRSRRSRASSRRRRTARYLLEIANCPRRAARRRRDPDRRIRARVQPERRLRGGA